MVDGEDQILKAVLWPLHVWRNMHMVYTNVYMYTYTINEMCKEVFQGEETDNSLE